ncbi:MAG TPA: autotransporter domain-containing protein [Allosphingosinicella sp.]|jgi:outer membrane autotransporter protein
MSARSRSAWLATATFAVLGWSGSAQAQCSTVTPVGGPTTLTCALSSTTTAATNSNQNNPATTARSQNFNNSVVGVVNPGVTISGWGLHVAATSNLPIVFTNNGNVTSTQPALDDLEILLERALQVRSEGGDVTYNGTGDVSTTNDATAMALFTRNLGNIYVGSEATPATGDFTGRSAVTITQAVSPGATDPASPLRDLSAYFHGGSFNIRPDDSVGVGIAISAQDSDVILVTTGNSVISTVNGVPGGGILVNSLAVNSQQSGTVHIETDALIGTTAAPMQNGIVVFRYFEGLGATDVNLTGTGSIAATQWGISVDGSEAGSPVTVSTAAGSSINILPDPPNSLPEESAGIRINTYLGGNVTVDVAGSIAGGDYGIYARPENGTLDVTIQPTATVSGSLYGLRENRFGGAGPTNILVLGTLSSPQTAADFSGTLRVGNGGTAGTIAGNVLNRGNLIFERSDTITYGDVVSGTGALTKAGTGTLILTGANTYTGGTTIQAGTLQIGNGGTTGSIVGNVTDNGNLTFNRSDSITYAGVVSGTGSLTKTGAGTLTLSGNNSYTGATTVQQGILLVNGSTTGATTVNAGTTLGGTGQIGSGAFAGTVAPGSGGVGTLTTTGNVTFAAGSTFQVEVTPAGTMDRLAVGGTATLQGGTVQSLFLGSQDNQCGAPIQAAILTATGGVSGTFAGVTSNFAFLTPSLSYNANNVFLTLTRNAATFSEHGATANQQASAAAAEALKCGNALFDPLVQLSSAAAQSAFEQISGEIHASARGALLDDSRFVREAMLARREGGRAFWVSGYGSWGEIEGDGNAALLERESRGFFGGVDLPIGGGWSAGLGGGYSRADFDVDARASGADVRSWHAAFRLGGRFGGFGVGIGGAASWHRIDTDRSVAFTGFTDTPTARYDGRTVQAFARIGYEIPLGAATVEPFADLAWVDVDTDAFAESGGAARLTGQEESDSATFSTIGVRARAGMGQVSLTGSAGWRHAFSLDPSESTFTFAGGTTPFTVAGAPISEDAMALEAGLEIGIGGAGRLGLSYVGQIGDRSEDHGARATLSLPF